MKFFLVIAIVFSFFVGNAQVGIGTTTPNGALDVNATDKGLVIPRVSLTATNIELPVTNPAGGTILDGTVVYNTATDGSGKTAVRPGIYIKSGSRWVYMDEDLYSDTVADYNWDTVFTPGVYAGNGGTTNRPSGFNGYERLIIYQVNGVTTQFAVNGAADGISVRRHSGGTWTSWYQPRGIESEPWYGADDNAGATTNTEDIYHKGNIGIGTSSPAVKEHVLLESIGGNSVTSTNTANMAIRLEQKSNNNSVIQHFLANNSTTGVKQAVMGINPTYNSNDGIFLLSRTGSNDFSMNLNDGNFAMGTSPAVDTKLYVQGVNGGTLLRLRGGAASAELIFNDMISTDYPAGLSGLTTVSDGVQTLLPQDANLIFKIRNNDGSDGFHIVNNAGDHVFTANANNRIGIGAGTQVPSATMDIASGVRTGTYSYQGNTMYVTGGLGALSNGAEFVHSNGSAGVGIGWNGLYMTGTNGNNVMYLRSQSHVVLQPDNGSLGYYATTSAFYPSSNGVLNLGGSSNRWAAVYSVNGTIQTSDARLKKNIKPMQYGLSEVMNLKPVVYDWKNDSGTNKLGFIAQELKEVIPNVVIGDENKENLGVNYAELVPVLTQAIQEQQKIIEDLKIRIEKLENQK